MKISSDEQKFLTSVEFVIDYFRRNDLNITDGLSIASSIYCTLVNDRPDLKGYALECLVMTYLHITKMPGNVEGFNIEIPRQLDS